MSTKDIEQNIKAIFDNFSEEEFIYDFLIAYGISKTSITRLKKGDFNLSKRDNEVLYKRKVFFKVEESQSLLSSLEEIAKDDRILKHQPRFAILTDYKHLVAKDLKLGKNLDIKLIDLPAYFDFFLPLAGSEVYNASNDNKADRDASYKMAKLYDLLREENPDIYSSKEQIHNLNIFLSRLLFCYFAEDTKIFEEESVFTNTLVQHTDTNGSDVYNFLNHLFEKLNTKTNKNFPEYLAKFPYVNGGLFEKNIDAPKFSAKARKSLIELGDLDWKDINPDIFGSMIQAVVIDEDRSDLGMHYTSVPNILKLIKPLFLDEFYEEFEKSRHNEKKLWKLIDRISKIKFFDPACGSGNFLIITYEEIRALEIKILQQIIELKKNDLFLVNTTITLTQFYGIEIDDFAHEVAILSLWLVEHQMNQYFEEQLEGHTEHKSIIPLKKSGTIIQGNATRLNWEKVCPIAKNDAGTELSRSEVYVIGNPPYLGSRRQNKEQKEDLKFVFQKNYKSLDYISIWFYKGARYIEDCNVKIAFVSTNSICQGDQVAITWSRILNNQIEIDFAHQSFKWTNNAKGNAGVTVIIVGLRNVSNKPKYIFKDNFRKSAKNINPYLLDATNVVVTGRSKPLSGFPEIRFGNMPNDGGNLILNENEKRDLVRNYSKSTQWIKKYMGGADFIRGIKRYSIWISDDEMKVAENIPELKRRFDKVVVHRINSSEKSTREKAKTPNRYYFSSHQNTDSIIIPRTSSERREYIPIGFLNDDTMPKGLKQAHQELDEAIEKCYRLQPFKNDTERLEYLFKLYEEMIKKGTLFAKQKKSRKRKK